MLTHTEKDTDYTIWHVLHQTTEMLHKLRKRRLTRIGLSEQEAEILAIIASYDRSLSDSEIALRMQQNVDNLPKLLLRMKRKGLITIDDKEFLVILTPRGRKNYNELLIQKDEYRVLTALSDTEKDQLQLLLAKIVDGSSAP